MRNVILVYYLNEEKRISLPFHLVHITGSIILSPHRFYWNWQGVQSKILTLEKFAILLSFSCFSFSRLCFIVFARNFNFIFWPKANENLKSLNHISNRCRSTSWYMCTWKCYFVGKRGGLSKTSEEKNIQDKVNIVQNTGAGCTIVMLQRENYAWMTF